MIDFLKHFFGGALVGVLVGIVAGTVVVVAFILLRARKRCPACDAALPKLRNNWSPLRVIWVCPIAVVGSTPRETKSKPDRDAAILEICRIRTARNRSCLSL